jgi:hypothetical protein
LERPDGQDLARDAAEQETARFWKIVVHEGRLRLNAAGGPAPPAARNAGLYFLMTSSCRGCLASTGAQLCVSRINAFPKF